MKYAVQKILGISVLLASSAFSFADNSMAATLKRMYPNTQFNQVRESPVKGIYEVQMGQNIAYVQEDGRYFIFGAMYDMLNQKDLTAERRTQLDKVNFADLPLKNAIKIKKGNGGKGKREFVLFSDPDCPFCRRLEETLAGMTDYTVYVFLFPIRSLHPEAVEIAEAVWCSRNKEKAWNDYMLNGIKPASKTCTNPVADNVALADKLNIRGTPTMIHKDGRKTAGAMARPQLEQWLNGG